MGKKFKIKKIKKLPKTFEKYLSKAVKENEKESDAVDKRIQKEMKKANPDHSDLSHMLSIRSYYKGRAEAFACASVELDFYHQMETKKKDAKTKK